MASGRGLGQPEMNAGHTWMEICINLTLLTGKLRHRTTGHWEFNQSQRHKQGRAVSCTQDLAPNLIPS